MRFKVPQFIEIDDKIFGPLTFKQFVYLAGGAGICVLLFMSLPTFIAILISGPVGAFSGALAFYKYNGRPFIELVEDLFKYLITNKLYIWKKDKPVVVKSEEASDEKTEREQVYLPKLSESKLKDLTWSLDIKDVSKISSSESEINKFIAEQIFSTLSKW